MKMAFVDLGVRGDGIRAELYKMLLYEKGAMFKLHADSEKVPGMFATLVMSFWHRITTTAMVLVMIPNLWLFLNISLRELEVHRALKENLLEKL